MIAGFPGETDEDHAATLAFIEALPFTYLHVFSYSKRPGTSAAALLHHVPGAVLKRRARKLRALGERKAVAFRQSQTGRELRVLTLRQDENEPSTTPALSSHYLKLRVDGAWPPNQWLDVRAVNSKNDCLLAEVLGSGECYDSKMTCASA